MAVPGRKHHYRVSRRSTRQLVSRVAGVGEAALEVMGTKPALGATMPDGSAVNSDPPVRSTEAVDVVTPPALAVVEPAAEVGDDAIPGDMVAVWLVTFSSSSGYFATVSVGTV